MPTGILRSWNDERGFGFIAPAHGGRELFVHISAFPRDGSRPSVGETLTYEFGRGKEGHPQAVKVQRIGRSRTYGQARMTERNGRRSPLRVIVGVALLLGVVAFGYNRYVQETQPSRNSASSDTEVTSTAVPQFKCDGRIHCSQMTSCDEAKFFLANCPGTQMDGDNDGVPCERQWCTTR